MGPLIKAYSNGISVRSGKKGLSPKFRFIKINECITNLFWHIFISELITSQKQSISLCTKIQTHIHNICLAADKTSKPNLKFPVLTSLDKLFFHKKDYHKCRKFKIQKETVFCILQPPFFSVPLVWTLMQSLSGRMTQKASFGGGKHIIILLIQLRWEDYYSNSSDLLILLSQKC